MIRCCAQFGAPGPAVDPSTDGYDQATVTVAQPVYKVPEQVRPLSEVMYAAVDPDAETYAEISEHYMVGKAPVAGGGAILPPHLQPPRPDSEVMYAEADSEDEMYAEADSEDEYAVAKNPSARMVASISSSIPSPVYCQYISIGADEAGPGAGAGEAGPSTSNIYVAEADLQPGAPASPLPVYVAHSPALPTRPTRPPPMPPMLPASPPPALPSSAA